MTAVDRVGGLQVVPLSSRGAGSVAHVVRVAGSDEPADIAFRRQLQQVGILAGAQVTVVVVDDGSLVVRGALGPMRLSVAEADHVYVHDGDLAAISDAVARRSESA